MGWNKQLEESMERWYLLKYMRDKIMINDPESQMGYRLKELMENTLTGMRHMALRKWAYDNGHRIKDDVHRPMVIKVEIERT